MGYFLFKNALNVLAATQHHFSDVFERSGPALSNGRIVCTEVLKQDIPCSMVSEYKLMKSGLEVEAPSQIYSTSEYSTNLIMS